MERYKDEVISIARPSRRGIDDFTQARPECIRDSQSCKKVKSVMNEINSDLERNVTHERPRPLPKACR